MKHRGEGPVVDCLHDFSTYDPNPILVVDKTASVLYCNEAADHLIDEVGGGGNACRFLPPNLPDLVAQCLESGQPVRRLDVQMDKRWFGWSLYPVPEKGTVLLHGSELTEFKQAEEEQSHLRMRLVQSDKMASIGQLAAGIAHEINNPLSFVNVNLKYIQESVGVLMTVLDEYRELESAVSNGQPDSSVAACLARLAELREREKVGDLLEELREMLAETKEGTERVRVIVQNLKEFSHAGEGTCKYASINQCLQATLKIVSYELKYKAKVLEDYGPVPEILCYPQELNQVFMNLLVNAGQALKQKGEIRIRTFQQDDQVAAEITDTGSGIAPEHLKRIFEPFFTTKEIGKGTGLGLSISYEIVQKHKGRIDVQSTVGVGTTFRIWLPINGKPEPPN